MTRSDRPFIGRERELSLLKELLNLKIASLVVMKGRRRIGKSRLAEEFGKGLRTLSFLGLAPEDGITAQQQRDHFTRQLEKQTNIRGIRTDDWDYILTHLADRTSTGRVIVILDEINWMGSKDRTFLPKLKTAWDAQFSKNPQLILILSGSVSGWIEKNILSSAGFFGRINLTITLEELPLHQCSQFWGKHASRISTYEKFKFLSVTGGVPRYLELMQPEKTAEDNIASLCFSREGILFNEFDRIFLDLFNRKGRLYKSLVEQVSDGPARTTTIFDQMDHAPSGTFTDYLNDLVQTGYLARDYTWDIRSGKPAKALSRYRLCDNYLRFYLRYIEPKKESILRRGRIQPPAWHTIMGLQFENLVLQNRTRLYPLLGIGPDSVVYDNPYFQTPTNKRRGCQIGFVIQTNQNILYLCEIKFSKNPIGASVIAEMGEKIERLKIPKGFSLRTVLIHVNGITESVEDAEAFSYVIDETPDVAIKAVIWPE